MFPLPKFLTPRLITFIALGFATLGLLFLLSNYVDKVEANKEEFKTVSEKAAECALMKMTFKMKRARALVDHQYVMSTIQGKSAKYPEPSEDRIFISLVKSCLSKGAVKQEQVNAANRLSLMLSNDDEYIRLSGPYKREQDRALMQRR